MTQIAAALFTWDAVEARSDLERFYLVRDHLPDRDLIGRDRNVAHACFRPITSTVSIVSDFVANGYQTIAACFHKPPYDPGKPDFPVPVLTLIYLRSSFHPI